MPPGVVVLTVFVEVERTLVRQLTSCTYCFGFASFPTLGGLFGLALVVDCFVSRTFFFATKPPRASRMPVKLGGAATVGFDTMLVTDVTFVKYVVV